MSEGNKENRSESYMLSHDIDWYFKYKGYIFHCASNGGIIPKDCRQICNLDFMTRSIENMTLVLTEDDLYINEEHVENVVKRQLETWERLCGNTPEFVAWFNSGLVRELYLSSFVMKARKGLIAWDRLYVEGERTDIYVLVAAPKEDIMETMITNSVYQTALGDAIDISNSVHISEDKKTFSIDVR